MEDEMSMYGKIHTDETPEVRVMRLQKLLTALYVAVLGNCVKDVPDNEFDRLMDTVLAAGEGQSFEDLELPWPAHG